MLRVRSATCISIHFFPKDAAVWPNGRVSIVDIEKICSLLFALVLVFRPGF